MGFIVSARARTSHSKRGGRTRGKDSATRLFPRSHREEAVRTHAEAIGALVQEIYSRKPSRTPGSKHSRKLIFA